MDRSTERLRDIYDRTSGYCHLCGKKLSFKNYNAPGRRGAWHIEHSKPRSKGGTNRLNNLYPACIVCNSEKSDRTTRTARAWNGRTRAPLSPAKRKKAKVVNALLGAGAGFAVGSLFGRWGRVIGTLAGARLGHKKNPDK